MLNDMRPPLSRAQVLTAGICALVLSVGLARFAYTPLLPVMSQQAGLSALQGGWLASFNYMGYLSGAILASLMHRLDSKFRLYRLWLLIAVVSTAAMGLSTDFRLWALLRFVAGLSSTAGLLLASGLVLNWLVRHQYRPRLGVHFAGIGLGIALSGLLATLMAAAQLAWNRQWLALGAGCALLLIPAWRWMPRPQPLPTGGTDAETPPPARRWLGLFIASYFCAGFGFVVSATFIVAMVGKLSALEGHGNLVWIIVGLAAVPSTLLSDRLANALDELPALMLMNAVQLLSFVLALSSDAATAQLLGGLLFGLSFPGIVSLTLSMAGRRFPANPAKAMARLTLSYGAAQIIAPVLTGSLADSSGSYRGGVYVAAAVVLLGIGLLEWMRRTPEQPASGGR